MLALPVERLVGNGSHRSSRPPSSSIPVSSLSPADSNASSDSSNSLENTRGNLQNCPAIVSKFELIVGGRRMGEVTSTTKDTVLGKRPGNAETPDTMSPKSPPRSPGSPSEYSEAVNNNNNHVMKVKRERLSNERSPSPVPLNLNVHFTKSNNTLSSSNSSKGSQPLLRVSSESESRKDHVENQSDNNSNRTDSRTSVLVPVSPVVVQKKSSVNHEMNNRLDICDDRRSPLGNHCNEIVVSRPPSSNSTISNSNSISPQSSSSNTNCLNFRPSPSPPQHSYHRHSSHLKFSIEDILRPDFGHKSAGKHSPGSTLISPSINKNSKVRTKHRANSVKSNNSSLDLSHSGVGNKPSSVKNYSEDSNSSCASSSTTNTTTNQSEISSTRHHSSNRNPEVIDESKINPQIPKGEFIWPAWVYCTRYSDRPSSGRTSFRRPRSRREKSDEASKTDEEKRPRTAFTSEQLGRLKVEFDENRYLTEKRRQDLARDLKLHENQIKIWFQNKRAKLKKSTGQKGTLALQLMAQGLYNHSTIPMDEDEEMEMEMASQR